MRSKIGLRIATNSVRHIDVSVAEYANKPGISKYYKDKLKLALSGLIHLKKYVSSNNTTAELKSIPLILVEGLEGVSFMSFLVDNDWLALQKIDAIDVPITLIQSRMEVLNCTSTASTYSSYVVYTNMSLSEYNIHCALLYRIVA